MGILNPIALQKFRLAVLSVQALYCRPIHRSRDFARSFEAMPPVSPPSTLWKDAQSADWLYHTQTAIVTYNLKNHWTKRQLHLLPTLKAGPA